MIYGVNRKIIEISRVQSDVFERAILIVKPEHSLDSRQKLKKDAVMFIKTFEEPGHARDYRISRKALWLMLAATTVVCITLGVILLY